jgi:RNA polymerase sigma-70 factor (ECF subfamily)
MGAHQVSMSETNVAVDQRARDFEQHRGRLFGLAYRMLGLRAEAEDIVQETYLRWHAADHDAVRSPEAWLVTVATRLSIDRLRALQADRVSYVGEWLPEPIVDERPDHNADLRDDISLAFMHVLERLGPEERAAFLLHEVLDTDYPEIARILNKSESAVRQTVHRARERVSKDRRRFQVDEAQHRALVGRFVDAVMKADEGALMALFTENATWTADGGGKVAATINILHGNAILTKFLVGIRNKIPTGLAMNFAYINGAPGLEIYRDGRPFAAYAFEADGERISGVYAVVNPDKLQGLKQA